MIIKSNNYEIDDNTQSLNKLDGRTILRFSHALFSGGGIEQYLDDLDNTLLSNNRVIIIRMYLSSNNKIEEKQIDKIGQGTLVKIPMETRTVRKVQDDIETGRLERTRVFFKNTFRDWIIYNPFLYKILFKEIIRKRPLTDPWHEAPNIRQELYNIFSDFNVDITVMHDIGKNDSAKLIEETRKRGIPFVVVNHFSNDRLNHISIREQIIAASGIAGVTGVGVPKHLRKTFVNIADGIDPEIFKPEAARPVNPAVDVPVVILPARIIPTKGQKDLIEATAMLRNEGLCVKVALAGRSDSLQYENELKRKSRQLGIAEDVLFLGQLNKEELRDWYGASSIMAFPTYHHEGLPRILMETQAMQVPPIAYIIGGIPEGIIHERTGFLILKGDIKGLAKNMRELLTNEEKRKKMGEEGRKFVMKRFSLQALAARHEDFYLRCLKSY